jgi:NAD(P)H-dependent FMN reductase
MIKVLGIPSCIHKQASSQQLLNLMKSVGGSDWVLTIADLSSLPLFNRDLQDSLSFQKSNVEYFRSLVDESNAVIFCASEYPLGYAYSVSAPLKNAIDWAVIEPNLLENKAAAFLGKKLNDFPITLLFSC